MEAQEARHLPRDLLRAIGEGWGRDSICLQPRAGVTSRYLSSWTGNGRHYCQKQCSVADTALLALSTVPSLARFGVSLTGPEEESPLSLLRKAWKHGLQKQ